MRAVLKEVYFVNFQLFGDLAWRLFCFSAKNRDR